MKRIVILISGRGSNMEAIVRACDAESWPCEVAAVVSNRPDASGLLFAAERGIATRVVDHKRFGSRDDFDAALSSCIDSFSPDLVVLAGFMRILGTAFVERYSNRMMNIHPSLLPAFPGLHTHRSAIATGCKLVGATVHFVTAQLDHGPIVLQSAVPVLADDDESALASRVLATEHVIYSRAVRWFVEDRLRLAEGRVSVSDGSPQWFSALAMSSASSTS